MDLKDTSNAQLVKLFWEELAKCDHLLDITALILKNIRGDEDVNKLSHFKDEFLKSLFLEQVHFQFIEKFAMILQKAGFTNDDEAIFAAGLLSSL